MSVCYNCDTDPVVLTPGKYFETCPVCGAWIVGLNQYLDFSELYAEKYFSGDEYLNYELGKKVHRKNFVRKLKILEKHIDLSKMRILEIGSASGEFLKVAREMGVTSLLGVEISEFARNQAFKNGFEVLSPFDPNLDAAIKKFNPNLILGWDVWEHLETPSSIFKHYLSFASPDSFLALTTVDASSRTASLRGHKWRQFHPPTHLNYPTKNSFNQFCSKNHLLIVSHFHFGYFRPMAEYLAALFGKRKWIIESKLLFKTPIYLNLYDTQMIITKKESSLC
jgi:hypothetical protein